MSSITRERFEHLTARYPDLRVAVVGDFFLDRYLEIDPARAELSIETGLPVHNVVDVRSQPGAAGTILDNLVALGVGTIHAVGFAGDDGEGFELRRALASRPGVVLDAFLTVSHRRTPVYCKPLVLEPGQPPRELNRLDTKNWTPTPDPIQAELAHHVQTLMGRVDAVILLDQVDVAETGVATGAVCRAVRESLGSGDRPVVLADSRRGPGVFPPLGLKMNAAELARMVGGEPEATPDVATVARQATEIGRRTGHPVFVTLAEQGMVGVRPGEDASHAPAYPVRGPIDVVGAGDSVTANLAAALAAGGATGEAMALAMAAASVVVHRLGTTGAASRADVAGRLFEG